MNYLKSILASLLALILVACQSTAPKTTDSTVMDSTQQTTLKVVTTFYPVYYLTSEIAGDKAEVSMLLNGTVEAHDFEPSAKDIATINESGLFVYSSESMETWVPTVEKSLGKDKQSVFVDASVGVTFLTEEDSHEGEEHDEEEGHHHDVDPHIWLDPIIAQQMTENITEALVKANPENKATYEKNRDTLVAALKEIANEYEAAFKGATNKMFVTQHAAFGYMVKRYGLEQIAIAGLQASEPSAQAIAEVTEEMKEHQLSVIYVDPTSSDATAKAVSRENGASIEYLYTMESPVKGKDFLQLLRDNLTALKKTVK